MCGWPYLDTMYVDRTNLIMRYLSIWWSDLKTRNTVTSVRISRSFLWYVMNELMHVMQRQVDACNAKTNWWMWCTLWYIDGHSSHSPWLNYGCKIWWSLLIIIVTIQVLKQLLIRLCMGESIDPQFVRMRLENKKILGARDYSKDLWRGKYDLW